MTVLGSTEYPCHHGHARIGDASVHSEFYRKCPTCRTKYRISLVPASDHVQTLTGQRLFRIEWSEE